MVEGNIVEILDVRCTFEQVDDCDSPDVVIGDLQLR